MSWSVLSAVLSIVADSFGMGIEILLKIQFALKSNMFGLE